MSQFNAKDLEARTKAFVYFLIATFAILGVRLWYLQIIKGADFEEKSLANSVRLVPIPAPRGIFYDRNRKPLVNSRLAYSVSIIPRELPPNPEAVYRRLGRILNLTPEEISNEVKKGEGLPYFPVRLSRDVDAATVTRVEEARLDLPGVIVEEIPVRNYLLNSYGSHLFGYLGKVSAEEWATLRDKGYAPSDVVGKTGLEKQYETYLRGKDGGQQVEVNRVNRPVRVLGTVEPRPGNSLVLTIDRNVQVAAEKALDDQLAWIRKNTPFGNAQAGAVVALDPDTGAVIAMTSRPDFDPSQFVSGVPAEYWAQLTKNPFNPFQNRVTTAALAPGSTFKAITAIAALSEGVTSDKEIFVDRGRDPVYPQKACWLWNTQRRFHGEVDIEQGLQVSCNIVFYELGRRLGIDRLAQWSRYFGLGEPTGLNLYPGEAAGNVPDRKWKQRVFKRSDQRIWYPIETLDVSIGQGALQVTPMQLAVAYSAIANGGTIYRPYVLQAITTPGGQVLQKFGSQVRRRLKIEPKVRDAVVKGLGDVIAGGTAAGAFAGFPIPVAGKTGSAELSAYSNDLNAWFASFAPIDHPKIVVIVMLERGGHGGSSAAPIARQVMEAFFKTKKPQPPVAAPAPAPKPPAAEANEGGQGAGGRAGTVPRGSVSPQNNTLPPGQSAPPTEALPRENQLPTP